MNEPTLREPSVPETDHRLLRPGHTNCGGCGMSVMLNVLGRALDEHRVQLVVPACCAIVASGAFPCSAYGVPMVSSTFAATAAVATGLAQAADMNGDGTRVIALAGDGGTYDIGMATVSAAAERDEDILYLCYDNEIYGNTGGQGSSATPRGATTTTTPQGKDVGKKDILGIMTAHRIPYVASVSLAHVEDAMRKMRHALATRGFRFLHILSPCPTGWKSEPADGIRLVRLAVRAGLYPVYEVFDGDRLEINVEPEMSEPALREYFERQGRFRRGAIDLADVMEAIRKHWRSLRRQAAAGGDDEH